MKRHAHIYKDSQTCHAAFKDFNAGFGYQRSDSGMWYASHDETHNFFSAAHVDKLLGINWDTIEIAKDVNSLDNDIIIWSCMDTDSQSMKLMTTAEPTETQAKSRKA